MQQEVTSPASTQVARPLKVLVPLIKEDLRQGDEAARSAAMPYYQAAGEKMLEAKPQMKHGEFTSWVKRHFRLGKEQSSKYMQYALATRSGQKSAPAQPYTSLDDFRRRHLGEDRTPGSQRDKDWREPVKAVLGKVDVATLNIRQDELKKAEDRAARRALALQLIDIGFKALATKLHPDKGGSREAMARLNQVRNDLKNSIRY